jgi:uncharacterized protein GlcG (DUF336 family)
MYWVVQKLFDNSTKTGNLQPGGDSGNIQCMSIRRFVVFTLVSTVAALAQGLPTQKVLTLDVAQTIAQEALAKCRADGYKVTVTVVDSANMLKAFLRDDGSNNVTVEVGRMKVNFVMAYGRPSAPPANAAPGAVPIIPNVTYAQGGIPIKVGDQLIGAVSVSGAPGGERDAACASAGLAKVADKLK